VTHPRDEGGHVLGLLLETGDRDVLWQLVPNLKDGVVDPDITEEPEDILVL
jgi:hypothetical protein